MQKQCVSWCFLAQQAGSVPIPNTLTQLVGVPVIRRTEQSAPRIEARQEAEKKAAEEAARVAEEAARAAEEADECSLPPLQRPEHLLRGAYQAGRRARKTAAEHRTPPGPHAFWGKEAASREDEEEGDFKDSEEEAASDRAASSDEDLDGRPPPIWSSNQRV